MHESATLTVTRRPLFVVVCPIAPAPLEMDWTASPTAADTVFRAVHSRYNNYGICNVVPFVAGSPQL
jgi:hypothetical protein